MWLCSTGTASSCARFVEMGIVEHCTSHKNRTRQKEREGFKARRGEGELMHSSFEQLLDLMCTSKRLGVGKFISVRMKQRKKSAYLSSQQAAVVGAELVLGLSRL